MTSPGFDTLKFSQRLREAGLDERAARAITAAVAVNVNQGALATRADLKAESATLRTDLKSAHAAFRPELKSDGAALGTRLTNASEKLRGEIKNRRGGLHRLLADRLGWIIGIVLAGTGVVVAVSRAFPA
jgi:hypothetical protein